MDEQIHNLEKYMIEALLEIERWGKDLAVRIPSPIARAAGLKANQSVKLTVEDRNVIIALQSPKRLTLAERVERFDPILHGGEAMAVPLFATEINSLTPAYY